MWSDANTLLATLFHPTKASYRLDDKMQSHALTLGRNVGSIVDAVDVERAIDYFALWLKTLDCNSFSVYEGRGYWCGIPENIIRFEVFGISDTQAKNLASRLAKTFNQEAVMLLSINSRPKFVTGSES